NAKGNFRVQYSRSTDGNSFSAPVEVTQNKDSAVNSQVSVDQSNRVHVAWQDCDDFGCRIMYSRSTDQGTTFSTPQLLSFGIEYSELPTILTTSQGEVTVFWNGTLSLSLPKFQIFDSRSTDGGATFPILNTVSSDAVRNLYAPSIAGDGAGNAYLA